MIKACLQICYKNTTYWGQDVHNKIYISRSIVFIVENNVNFRTISDEKILLPPPPLKKYPLRFK